MVYKGVIIEESLHDRDILKQLKIIGTRVITATESHKTPWLKKWTLHTIEIPDSKADSYAQCLSRNIDKSHAHSWYVDYMNATTHYVVFSGRVFKINRKNPGKGYDEVKAYGLELGIPAHQLDLSFREIK